MAYVVRANWRAKSGAEAEVLDAIRKLTPISRQEPGNRFYQAYRDPAEPTVFRLFEIYDDEPAYQAHVASEHFQEYGFGQAIPLLEDRERFFYETID
jgi:quinol monooxygenase YgiN